MRSPPDGRIWGPLRATAARSRPGCVARARTAACEAPARVVQWWSCECTRALPPQQQRPTAGLRGSTLDLSLWFPLPGCCQRGKVDGAVAEAGPDRVGGPHRRLPARPFRAQPQLHWRVRALQVADGDADTADRGP